MTNTLEIQDDSKTDHFDEDLFTFVEQEGIFVSYQRLATSRRKLYGTYFFEPVRNTPFIILDESLLSNPSKHRAVLAEELGHHFAGVRSNLFNSDETSILKDETAALRWAVRYLSETRETGPVRSNS